MKTEWLEALIQQAADPGADKMRLGLIQCLARELGIELVERGIGGCPLTRAGVAYAAYARKMMDELGNAGRESRAIAEGRSGLLRLGLCEEVATPHLQGFLIRCREEFPGISWRIHEEPAAQLIAALRRYEVDAVLMPRLPAVSADEDLIIQTVWEEPWTVMLPAGHELEGLEELGPEDLGPYPLVIPDPSLSPCGYDLVHEAFSRAGITPRVAAYCIGRSTMSTLVSVGAGVAFVPRSPRVTWTASADEVTERPFRADPMRILCVCNAYNPPGVAMQFLRMLMMTSPPDRPERHPE